MASTAVTDKASGLVLCNRAIDVATRPFLVSKLQQRASGSKPGRGRASRPKTSFGSGGFATLTNGSSSSSNGNGVSAPDDNGRALVNARRAAALRLATVEYLARNGMEIPALEVLGSNAGGEWAAELATRQGAEEETKADASEGIAAGTAVGGDPGGGDFSSGVFSGFGGRAVTKPKADASAAASGELSGDMFGAFDGPPPRRTSAKKPAVAAAASGELSGDMFGGFDAAPRTRPTPPAPPASSTASGELSGDMLGGFDAAPPRRKVQQAAPAAVHAAAAASGELSGDMFGGFDGPPRARPTPPAATASPTASGELSGDMFGGFDAAPAQRKAKQAAPAAVNAAAAASGELSGDMFGGFDAAPPRRKASPVASGELSGDMFGGFDGPRLSPAAAHPATVVKPRLTSPTAVATGELSSDLFSGFDGPPAAMSSPGSGTRTSGSTQMSLGSPGGSSVGGGPTSPRASSYGYFEGEEPSWEEYDRRVAERNGGDDGVVNDGVNGRERRREETGT